VRDADVDAETSRARRGRPRDEAARRAIHAAAIDLLVEKGYGALTVDAIARRAGVGRQTIYRWWSAKADVVLEALVAKAETTVQADDLRGFLHATFANALPFAPVLSGLMAEAQLDRRFGEQFVTGFLEHRRQALAEHVRRELPRVDPAMAADLVFGMLWYRILIGRAKVPRNYATTVLRAVEALAV
jgi:AcrR family transcriptional regulator